MVFRFELTLLSLIQISTNRTKLLAKNQKQKSRLKIGARSILALVAAVLIMGTVGVAIIQSMIPVNADYPVFGAPTNIYLKSIKTSDGGYVFASQSIKGGKVVPSTGKQSPGIHTTKGNLVSIHLINEEKSEHGVHSKHNINIDEFNVHSNDLDYFQTQTITFLADKSGTFDYHCTIHPEMRGTIVVQ